jgi:hypothetical protein
MEMKDKELRKIIKTIDTGTAAPEGLKEDLLKKVLSMEIRTGTALTLFERFIFEKPLRAACIISIPISGTLWAVTGSGFVKLLSGILG